MRTTRPIAWLAAAVIAAGIAGCGPEEDAQSAPSTSSAEATQEEEVVQSTPEPPPPPPAPPTPELTVGQENAINKAAEYLAYTSFSRSGLIKQLEFEGFSTEDATFGVDSFGADWSIQAGKKAADYMAYSSFSREGLISQLLFEGFTQAEAEYGASQVGF